MTSEFDGASALESFSGSAPLFPLPNAVLFPRVVMPLHIFEPRYRAMVADALEGEGLIAMALLQPGWETLPEESVPPIHRMVGLGRIEAHEKLPDGRYQILLRGIARAEVAGELNTNLPYRVARLQICRDRHSVQHSIDRTEQAVELLNEFAALFSEIDVQDLLRQTLAGKLPLATICDVLAAALPEDVQQIQRCLEELDVDRRCELIRAHMRRRRAEGGVKLQRFPPEFSRN